MSSSKHINRLLSVVLVSAGVMCQQAMAGDLLGQIVGSVVRQAVQPQQPRYTNPPLPRQDFNPPIYDSGRQITGVTYDPFSGKIRIQTNRDKVRESVLDPNRQYVDPGSFERVNEYRWENGARWHITGTRWTSNGVPHGNLTRRRVTGNGGPVEIEERENVVYSPGVNNTNRNTNVQSTQRQRVQYRGTFPQTRTQTQPRIQTPRTTTQRPTNRTYNPW